MINIGDKVIHGIHGGGTVTGMNREFCTVKFNNGVEISVESSTLQKPLYS